MDTETRQLLGEVKKALGDQGQLKDAVEQLEKQMQGMGQTIEEKIRKVRSTAWDASGRYRGLFPSEDQARSFGLFVLSQGAARGWATEALKSEFPDVVRAFGTTDAGNLIPEEYTGSITDLINQYGVFERNCRKVPMSSDTQRWSKKTGRMSAVPMDEGNAIAETKPTLAAKALQARKWGSYVEIPSEVSEDAAAAIGEMVASDMAEAFALAIDQAGFLGDGTATYNSITGVLNALITEAIVTLSAGNTAWSDITQDDFLQVISLCAQKTFLNDEAKWYCSSQFFWTVMAPIALAAGGVTAAEIQGRRSLMFLGFPVELTQVMPTTSAADQVPCVFGNLRQGAVFGDRRQLAVRQSEHFKFDTDMLAMLGTRRFDIQVHGAGQDTDVEVLAALQTAAS